MITNKKVIISDLIGIPYKENGRTVEGLDCYGLAIEVEKRLGKNLIDVCYDNHNIELSNEYAPLLNIRKIVNVYPGALLEMHIGSELHIGVALNDKLMIHATRNQGVRISQINAYPITNIYEVI